MTLSKKEKSEFGIATVRKRIEQHIEVYTLAEEPTSAAWIRHTVASEAITALASLDGVRENPALRARIREIAITPEPEHQPMRYFVEIMFAGAKTYHTVDIPAATKTYGELVDFICEGIEDF